MARTRRRFSRAQGQARNGRLSWLRLWLVGLVLVPFAFACSRGIRYANEEPGEPDEGEFPQGVFYYQATALNQQLRGRFIIVDTLVILEPENDYCLPPNRPLPRGSASISFSCDGAPTPSGIYSATVIHISLRYPKRESTWSRPTVTGTSGTTMAQGRVCVQGHNDRGRFICDRYDYQSRTSTRWVSGRLHVRRTPFPSPDTTGVAGRP